MKRWFSDDEHLRAHSIRMRRHDPNKSARVKEWWKNPKNRDRMLKLLSSAAHRAKISIRMGLNPNTASMKKFAKTLKKMGIPYLRNYAVVFHYFDFVLYPVSDRPILVDFEDKKRKRNINSKKALIDGLGLSYDYGCIEKGEDIEQWILKRL